MRSKWLWLAGEVVLAFLLLRDPPFRRRANKQLEPWFD